MPAEHGVAPHAEHAPLEAHHEAQHVVDQHRPGRLGVWGSRRATFLPKKKKEKVGREEASEISCFFGVTQGNVENKGDKGPRGARKLFFFGRNFVVVLFGSVRDMSHRKGDHGFGLR